MDPKLNLPDESMKIQRVDIYLQDLKERLKQLRLQHSAVIQSSEDILNEINEVSSTLPLVENSEATNISPERMTKIKKLIWEFEEAKDKEHGHRRQTVSLDEKPHVDIKKILQDFEKLNESHLLSDSLQLFRKAKVALDKIDNFLGASKDAIEPRNNVHHKIQFYNYDKADGMKECSTPGHAGLNKNQDPLAVRETLSNYVSCCSSLASVSKDFENSSALTNSLSGYEGDNDDSEFDVFSASGRNK
ncbi:uncharacterized protein [Musca autumnalis]|uniref:uncharacterized protein n=1 Tax=Musca autumnalis TaxID=221902 RepID=UPI003CF4D2F9